MMKMNDLSVIFWMKFFQAVTVTAITARISTINILGQSKIISASIFELQLQQEFSGEEILTLIGLLLWIFNSKFYPRVSKNSIGE